MRMVILYGLKPLTGQAMTMQVPSNRLATADTLLLVIQEVSERFLKMFISLNLIISEPRYGIKSTVIFMKIMHVRLSKRRMVVTLLVLILEVIRVHPVD